MKYGNRYLYQISQRCDFSILRVKWMKKQDLQIPDSQSKQIMTSISQHIMYLRNQPEVPKL